MSKMQVLSMVLSLLFVAMLAHSIKLSLDQTATLKKYHDMVDVDGDKKMSKEEVGRWFQKTFGEGKKGATFDAFIELFDTDGDGSFSDDELSHVLDASDEWAFAPAGFRVAGGDALEAAEVQTALLGLLGLVVIVALYFEAFAASRTMNRLEGDLREKNATMRSLEAGVGALTAEREALAAAVEAQARDTDKDKDSHHSASTAAAEEASARLAVVELALAAKKKEAAEAKLGVVDLRRKMEANLTE